MGLSAGDAMPTVAADANQPAATTLATAQELAATVPDAPKEAIAPDMALASALLVNAVPAPAGQAPAAVVVAEVPTVFAQSISLATTSATSVVNTFTPAAFTGRGWYVDSSTGDDANAGTIDKPWRSLARAASASFGAGDALLLKCGSAWRESLNVGVNRCTEWVDSDDENAAGLFRQMQPIEGRRIIVAGVMDLRQDPEIIRRRLRGPNA